MRDRYAEIVRAGRRPLIIDCAATIVASAAYVAMSYPAAQIVAIEPSEENLAEARRNCRSAQVELTRAAVGSRRGRSDMADPGWGSWSLRVRPFDDGPIAMVTIPSILSEDRYRSCTPFVVKIDIEGGEDDVFADDLEWIDRFPVVMIELHDSLFPGEARSRGFLEAVSAHNRGFLICGETVISIANGPPDGA